ncbi:MAG: rhodanese-like domain-containing protein [Bacteroidota bacterium]
MRYITPADLKAKLDKGEVFCIIDTRDGSKFAECHLPGAVSVPQISIPDNLDKFPSEGDVIIYCQYGMKSEQVFLYLKEKAKRRNIYILEGGIYQWAKDVDSSLPVL